MLIFLLKFESEFFFSSLKFDKLLSSPRKVSQLNSGGGQCSMTLLDV